MCCNLQFNHARQSCILVKGDNLFNIYRSTLDTIPVRIVPVRSRDRSTIPYGIPIGIRKTHFKKMNLLQVLRFNKPQTTN